MGVVVADATSRDRAIPGPVDVVVPGEKDGRRKSDGDEAAPRVPATADPEANVIGEPERNPEGCGVPVGIAEPIRVGVVRARRISQRAGAAAPVFECDLRGVFVLALARGLGFESVRLCEGPGSALELLL
jgi:hypothetical protein